MSKLTIQHLSAALSTISALGGRMQMKPRFCQECTPNSKLVDVFITLTQILKSVGKKNQQNSHIPPIDKKRIYVHRRFPRSSLVSPFVFPSSFLVSPFVFPCSSPVSPFVFPSSSLVSPVAFPCSPCV